MLLLTNSELNSFLICIMLFNLKTKNVVSYIGNTSFLQNIKLKFSKNQVPPDLNRDID